jgi:predicted RNase H-like HicB family nuclease
VTQHGTSTHYSMVLEWDPEDQIYVVTVPELPGCRTHGTTYEEAVRHGKEAIESWIAAAHADDVPIPEPRIATAGTSPA